MQIYNRSRANSRCQIDKSAPAVSSGSPDGAWHAIEVSIPCIANDTVSGLSDSGDGNFTLTTDGPANTETSNASTNIRTVCDVAGNCATSGRVGGNKIDKKAPTITISTPSASAVYLLNQPVAARVHTYCISRWVGGHTQSNSKFDSRPVVGTEVQRFGFQLWLSNRKNQVRNLVEVVIDRIVSADRNTPFSSRDAAFAAFVAESLWLSGC